MKELILFLFVVVFISCQNSPQNTSANLNTSSGTPLVYKTESALSLCAENTESEILDLSKELSNPEAPGLHYRKVVLTSEAHEALDAAEFVCLSNVSHLPEEVQEVARVEASEEAEIPSWEILTTKWEYRKETLSCQENPQAVPACENALFFAEEGKLFSSNEENFNSLSQSL